MDNKITQIVEIQCKTTCKTLRKIRANFCANLFRFIKIVYNFTFPPTFPAFSTHFPTTTSPLYITNFFHYSTSPTITTINNLIERIRK